MSGTSAVPEVDHEPIEETGAQALRGRCRAVEQHVLLAGRLRLRDADGNGTNAFVTEGVESAVTTSP